MGLEADSISVSPQASWLNDTHGLVIHDQTRVDLPIIRVDITPQLISVFGTTDVQGSIFEGQYWSYKVKTISELKWVREF